MAEFPLEGVWHRLLWCLLGNFVKHTGWIFFRDFFLLFSDNVCKIYQLQSAVWFSKEFTNFNIVVIVTTRSHKEMKWIFGIPMLVKITENSIFFAKPYEICWKLKSLWQNKRNENLLSICPKRMLFVLFCMVFVWFPFLFYFSVNDIISFLHFGSFALRKTSSSSTLVVYVARLLDEDCLLALQSK